DSFRKAQDLAGTDANLRADALFNFAISRLQDIRREDSPDELETKIDKGLEALDAFGEVKRIDPLKEQEVDFGAGLTRETLANLEAPPPPPPQEQPQPGEGEGEGENEDQQEGSPPPPPEEG